MFELFYMGGPLFMGILSLLLLVVIVLALAFGTKAYNNQVKNVENFRNQMGYIKSVGLFAMVTGILGQLIGLYQAFVAIEQAGDISPSMLTGGLKVSMITTLYGVFIYLFSILLWFLVSILFDWRNAKLKE